MCSFFACYGHPRILPVPTHSFPTRRSSDLRINDAAAAGALRESPNLLENPAVDAQTVRITHWDKLTDRLTEDQVHHTNAEGLAAEERARTRMGDKVLTGGREKLGSA